MYRAAAGLLLHPDTEPSLRRLLEQAVDGGLMVRAAHIRQRVRAETLRARLKPALTEHVTQRRAAPCTGEPRDVLDAVLSACPAEVTHREAADLYMLLFRSIVGNVGYSVGWSVLLAGLRHTSASPWPWPADSVVREAARHRPFVWMVGRTAPGPIDIGGVPLPSETNISVCPYLLHHDGSWTSPGTFRPERWAEASGHGTYLPYSAGPFTCAGAGIAHTLTTEAVHALADSARLAVSGADPRPIVTNAAIPRPFTLHRTVRTSTHP
ncbi:cytochrome P450 [Streptomyces actinomycinicus]|uniref:cytochrome P450 n=1 Tax=Streptomyces actinomycinicus TaxID=1695166 RepID=UPI0027DA4FC8|nr:cytochrome P450 [Streptomyces actinomycinicus]